MIVMQYQFIFSNSFNMDTIQQRIEHNAHKLNGFPHLGFKAYMFQEKDLEDNYQLNNSYAPFYFWKSSEGMKMFLASSGYASLENDFGRPEICTYLPFIHEQHSNLCDTRYAWAIKESISPNKSIQLLLEQQKTRAVTFIHPNMTAYVIAFNTVTWQLSTWLFFKSKTVLQSFPQFENHSEIECQAYQVGYVST